MGLQGVLGSVSQVTDLVVPFLERSEEARGLIQERTNVTHPVLAAMGG